MSPDSRSKNHLEVLQRAVTLWRLHFIKDGGRECLSAEHHQLFKKRQTRETFYVLFAVLLARGLEVCHKHTESDHHPYQSLIITINNNPLHICSQSSEAVHSMNTELTVDRLKPWRSTGTCWSQTESKLKGLHLTPRQFSQQRLMITEITLQSD